ncbi:CbrC family protein [Gilliamella sp. ESL0443]|nr:CbrC family protein [Gilliamella sp. ESL0443]
MTGYLFECVQCDKIKLHIDCNKMTIDHFYDVNLPNHQKSNCTRSRFINRL